VLPWKRHEKTIININTHTHSKSYTIPYLYVHTYLICCVCVVGHNLSCDITRFKLLQISDIPLADCRFSRQMAWKYVTNTKRGYSVVNIIGFRSPLSTTPTRTVTSPTVITHLPILLPLWDRTQGFTLAASTELANKLTEVFTKEYWGFLWLDSPICPRFPQRLGFTITLRHTTDGRIPLDGGSVRRRDLYLTAHNIHNRQTSAIGGIRTHNPSKWAATNPRLRPRGHRNRLILRFYREKNGIKREERKKGNAIK
jgi:hypothetical protein